ncbi:MAG: hypothetical protein WKF88_10790 [Ferruginibacter sp.]
MKQILSILIYNRARTFFFILSLLLCSLLNFQCKKERNEYCTQERVNFISINNKEGIIVKSDKYNYYGVSLKVNTPGNIDDQVIGYVCTLPQNLQIVGLSVIVSGNLKNFNPEENISSEIAGQQLYYLEFSSIIKKP